MNKGRCAFVFIEGTNFWVLGIPFLRDYYHIHDYEGKRQGFIPTYTLKRLPAYLRADSDNSAILLNFVEP